MRECSDLTDGTLVRWLTVDEVSLDWSDRLDEAERSRLAALRGDAQRARFVGAAVLMREVLAELAGCGATAVGLDRECADCAGPHGRPVPTGAAAGLHVSASHSGPYVLVAASRRPVGVDVELLRETSPSPALLVRVLAEGEQAPEDEAGFAHLWSAKEAYLKAVGTGLATPMNQVRLDGDRAVHLGPSSRPGELTPLRPPVAGPPAAAHVCVLATA